MTKLVAIWYQITGSLEQIGSWLPQLGLRLLLGWEYFDSGLQKLRGQNWFADIQDSFMFPFNVIHPAASWYLATWFEIVGGLLLIAGLFTRFWAVSLIILTIVAVGAVHWGVGNVWAGDIRGYQTLTELIQGYAITNKGFGNYKLPLIFLVLFLPLLFNGAGRASIDYLLASRLQTHVDPLRD